MSKDKNYSLSEEHNGKLIKLYFDEDADTTKKKKNQGKFVKTILRYSNSRYEANL